MRILLVTSVLPWPLQRNGGGRRTHLLRRALLDLGHDVRTLAVMPGEVWEDDACPAGVDALVRVPPQQVRPSRLPGPLGSLATLRRRYAGKYEPDPASAARVRELVTAHRCDAVVVRYGWTLGRCDLPGEVGVPVYLDFDDVDWLALRSRFAAESWRGINGRIGMRLAVKAVRAALTRRVAACRRVWVASREDAADVPHSVPSVLPNIALDADEVPAPLPPARGNAVLFVGDLQHGPNADGLRRFVTQIWPAVRRDVPDARFVIVGRGMDDALRAAWAAVPGVEPRGFVDDLRAEYARAAVCVTPSWWGGGTKIKVAEAAGLGRAQVVTRAALRGFGPLLGDETAGPAVLTTDADDDFSDAIVRLLRDEPLRSRLAEAGVLHVTRHYTFDRFRDAVGHLVGRG